jgi:FkbM family methyltransferase
MRQLIDSCLERFGRIQVRARLQIFRGAIRQVDPPAAFVVRELLFYPMRPVVAMMARRRGGDIGGAWAALMRGAGNAFTYRLRADGRKIVIRHGTEDVFVMWELFDRRAYAIPAAAREALERDARAIRLVDLGANIGLGARFFDGELAIDAVIAYEPLVANLVILRRNRALDAPGRRWRIIDAAACTRDQDVSFTAGRVTGGRISTDAGTGNLRVRGRDVFRDLVAADLLKMDIEGGEWAILQDVRLGETSLRAVVVEFHPWGCPEPDPEACARRLLSQAGFTVGPADRVGPGLGIVWAWRT